MSKLLMCLNTHDSKWLCPVLHQNGFEVTSTSEESFALKLLDEGHFDLILIEDHLHLEHFAFKIKQSPYLNGVLLSQHLPLLLCPYEKGFLGAFDLKKPKMLISFLKQYLKLPMKKLATEHVDLNQEFIAASPQMRELFEKAKKIAKTQSSVLITGESGTGKEVIAQFIHQQSFRSHHPFVAINSCAISPLLLESELFGYEKGAFTGAMHKKIGRLETANHGSFFFDEIGETPLELQAKLLRVIQERSFERVGGIESIKLNIRFIAATNRNLEEAILQKHFREDLYYRLNVVPLEIPPLRERKEDIIPLAEHFMRKYEEKNQLKSFQLTELAKSWLISHSWPGNVRELSNVIERACVLAEGRLIDREDLILKKIEQAHSEIHDDMNLENMEKKMILKALQKTAGNKTQAAKLLGVSVKTLRTKI